MVSNPIHLCVFSHPENLKHIRDLVGNIMSTTDLSEKDQGSVILAVDEACSNIIRHSYQNSYTRKIDLTATRENNAVTFRIMDDGIQIDMTTILHRDIRDIRPGGLGLYIIQEVMDHVEYQHTSEGLNMVKMTKKLNP